MYEKIHSVGRIDNKRSVIFEVGLEDSSMAYLRIDEELCLNEDRKIIVVDAVKFLAMWKAEPEGFNHFLSHGNSDAWIKFRKYPDACDGFSKGLTNPVPVARVVCNLYEGVRSVYKRNLLGLRKLQYRERYTMPHVEIDNGRTRTIWLLNHGAKYFPVECTDSNGAERLLHNCGDQMFGSPSIKEILDYFD